MSGNLDCRGNGGGLSCPRVLVRRDPGDHDWKTVWLLKIAFVVVVAVVVVVVAVVGPDKRSFVGHAEEVVGQTKTERQQ